MTAIVNFPTPDTPEMRLARDVLLNIEHHHVDTVIAALSVLAHSYDEGDRFMASDAFDRICRSSASASILDASIAALYGPPAPRSWATLDSLLAWVCAGVVAGGVGVLIGRALAAWWVA